MPIILASLKFLIGIILSACGFLDGYHLFYGTQVGWRKTNVVYPFFKEGDYNWFYDQIRYIRQEIEVK